MNFKHFKNKFILNVSMVNEQFSIKSWPINNNLYSIGISMGYFRLIIRNILCVKLYVIIFYNFILSIKIKYFMK